MMGRRVTSRRWLAAKLRQLTAARVPVFWVTARANQVADMTAGIVRLRRPGWQLPLSGVASRPGIVVIALT